MYVPDSHLPFPMETFLRYSFGGMLALMLTTNQTVYHCLVWRLRERTGESSNPNAGSLHILTYCMKNFGLRIFRRRIVQLS